MPTHRLQFLMVVAAVVVLALPAITHAGDAPIFVVGNWGIGEIDGRIMLYLGMDRYLDTPIPAPPHGPRWDVVYNVFPFVVVGGVAFWLYRRRHNQTLQRTGAAGRAFEVQNVSESGPGR
jgi:Zn-dependent M28 family amino/carboxypeptidase